MSQSLGNVNKDNIKNSKVENDPGVLSIFIEIKELIKEIPRVAFATVKSMNEIPSIENMEVIYNKKIEDYRSMLSLIKLLKEKCCVIDLNPKRKLSERILVLLKDN